MQSRRDCNYAPGRRGGLEGGKRRDSRRAYEDENFERPAEGRWRRALEADGRTRPSRGVQVVEEEKERNGRRKNGKLLWDNASVRAYLISTHLASSSTAPTPRLLVPSKLPRPPPPAFAPLDAPLHSR
ncbi:hypothetical protein KM043_017741 [Ampulex compressa]|nr:hypothetical protein KM043_017741 [Ampulex compressa]